MRSPRTVSMRLQLAGLASKPISDAAVLDAIHRHDPAAWAAFDTRFRPMLEAYARRANIPSSEWSVCITELLADEWLRFSTQPDEIPGQLSAYLMRAVRNKYLYMKRTSECRERNHLAASVNWSGEQILPSTCSDDARRASAGPDALSGESDGPLRRFAREVSAGLNDEERAMLTWVSEGVPRARIAEWLGLEREVCAKRIWRLCRRLRMTAAERSKAYVGRDRRDIDRFLSRAVRQERAGPRSSLEDPAR